MKKTNEPKENGRLFGFLVKYVILSMLSIFIVLSIIFFLVYYRLEITRVTDSSIQNVEQLSLSCNSSFNSIRKLITNIYNDSYISYLTNGIDSDIGLAVQSYSRFKGYEACAPGIVSIYVYNKSTDSFYTTLSNVTKTARNNFFDYEAIEMIDNIRNVRMFYPIPRKIVLPGTPDVPNNTTNIFTFIYYGVPASSADKFRKAVMINVSEDWVNQSIQVWDSYGQGDICIIDSDGRFISSVHGGSFLNVSNDGFVKRILDNDKKSGYFVDDVSGVKSFVTYSYSSELDWYFIRVLPYATIYANIAMVGLVAICLLAMDLAVGFILAHFITRKAQKSIEEIISELKGQIEANRCDLDMLKEEYLYDSLTGNTDSSPKSIRREFSKYQIGLSAEGELYLLLFRMDGYYDLSDKLRPSDISILRRGIIHVAIKTFRERYAVEAADMKNDHVVLLLGLDGSGDHVGGNHIAGMARQVQEVSMKELNLSLSAVVGPPRYTFKDMVLIYNEAKKAADYRMFRGRGCFINADDLNVLPSEQYEYPADLEKRFNNSLMLGKLEAAGKILRAILDTTSGYSCTVMNSLLLRLTCSISNTLENFDAFSKYTIDYNFNSFLASLSRCETVDEVYGRFDEMIKHVYTIMERTKNSKYEQIVGKVIDMINREFADERICLNSIAAKISLSPSYLGKLFRNYTSKSIAEYINQIRMEKAAILLAESGLSVDEVSERVGFSYNNYFFTVFRKSYGLTPSEYRQRAKNQAL